jgi:hypothetical protein
VEESKYDGGFPNEENELRNFQNHHGVSCELIIPFNVPVETPLFPSKTIDSSSNCLPFCADAENENKMQYKIIKMKYFNIGF